MDVAFAMLADAANISREGTLNILGSFDRIHGSKFPLTWNRMMLVMRFVASAAEYGTEKNIDIVTMDADGKQLGKITGKVKLPAKHTGRQLKINHMLPMSVKFPTPGEYCVEILVNGEPKASVPVEVVQREQKKDGPPPEAQQGEEPAQN